VGHLATPVDEHADLAAGLVGERRELAREVLGDEPLRGEVAPREALELADLAGLEAVGVPEDADGIASRSGGV
jgi:hypothetical protein